jgi:hypothetical protein
MEYDIEKWKPTLRRLLSDIQSMVHEHNPTCTHTRCPTSCEIYSKIKHKLSLETALLWEVTYQLEFLIKGSEDFDHVYARMDTIHYIISLHQHEYYETNSIISKTFNTLRWIRYRRDPPQEIQE